MITCHLRYQQMVYRLVYQEKLRQFINTLVKWLPWGSVLILL